MKTRLSFVLSVVVALSPVAPVFAQDSVKLGELERKVDVLTQEIEKLKLGESADPIAEGAVSGFAPAASKVYRARLSKISIGGYGEMTYQNFSKRRQDADPAAVRDEADFLRAVLYVGTKFNDWILFNSELEFEHGSTGKGRGEVSIEQAYIDFQLRPEIGVRAGTLIVPMGLQNEVHEPTTFHGVRRTSVEQNIIASTWRENGAGVYGDFGPLSYRAYLVSGLQATTNTGVTGFAASGGLRNGRSSGAKSYAEDLASVTRIDYKPVSGVMIGGSVYVGQADQSLIAVSVPVSLWESHLKAEYRGAELRALYAEGRVGNADSVNIANGYTSGARTSIGSKLFGGYVEGAFDVLTLSKDSRGHSLSPFFRYERYDTQAQTPAAFAKNPANSRVEYTAGLTYKPISQVAVKADHQWMRNQARTGVNQWNLGLAYIF
ncbi:MAG: porin [Elusimicrobiota bacterium]